ncbi:MAG: polyphosphate kinase 1 [Desulfopila sp.]|nr:polyphosphate kinase 1 [Desulfopila sp.]
MDDSRHAYIDVDGPENYINRELSWLSFARRVLQLAEDTSLPLLERLKFAGIMGMIFDEFVMKRMGGLHQKIRQKPRQAGVDGLTPCEELELCWEELQRQTKLLSTLIEDDLRPALAAKDIHLLSYTSLSASDKEYLQTHFRNKVLPILTPLAVDAAHPFPFISNLSFNLAIVITGAQGRTRFVRLKVPSNRSRWVRLPGGEVRFVPLEDIIAHNLHDLFPKAVSFATYFFRVTRAAKDNPWDRARMDDQQADELQPGSIISMVTAELNFRKFAGIVRLEVGEDIPAELLDWLVAQLNIERNLVMRIRGLVGPGDLLSLKVEGKNELRDIPHVPADHERLRHLPADVPEAFFSEIRKKDILLHLPYHSFDTSILRLLQIAAVDPKVLAIKLTIYRTSSQSPIIKALVEAAQRGKQVAVLVEITARFDEAPNIIWGQQLERVGAHVVYGVERLKTHVKLAMIVREEDAGITRYVHVGTGNYHTGTARLYEDLGIISSNRQLGEDVSRLFNELTGAIPAQEYALLLVAPHNMRERFTEMIRREAENSKAGKPAAITVKINQLQDQQIIRELYLAGQAGVRILIICRGLCSLRASSPGLSENIRVRSILGRFLEHSRIYRFENNGDPEFFIGSADWMKRNLDRRMESIVPVLDHDIKAELERILEIYESDNTFAWEMQPDGSYDRCRPLDAESPITAQRAFVISLMTEES